jgi:hypothetical protein
MCDNSHDITPLLMSFLLSKGPDVRGAISIGHLGVIVGDMANLSGTAMSMWDAALLFKVPCSVTEQALVDVHAFMCEMAVSTTLEAVCVVFVGAVFPPIVKLLSPALSMAQGISVVIGALWRIYGSRWWKALARARACRELYSSHQILLYCFWTLANCLARSPTLSCACQKCCTLAWRVSSCSC